MKGSDLAWLRLRTQRLSGAPFGTPRDVVRALTAVQSQELAVAKWSVGRRARNATIADVDRALGNGTILRTHMLRPTWHFVRREDIRWLMLLTAPRVRAAMAYYDRKLGLTNAVFAKGHAVIVRALRDRKAMTRVELGAALRRAGLEATGQRLGHFLMRAELDLIICSGAPTAKHHTYALLDARAPGAATKTLNRDEALAELTQRYFTGHGPATLKDFTWWSSLTMADAKRGMAMLGRPLQKVVVDDKTFFFGDAASPQATARPSRTPEALLLQGYDEYIIGYRDTRSVLNVGKHAGALPRGQVMFTHAIVIDGQVVGHWRRGAAGDKQAVVEAFFSRPPGTAEKRALGAEVARYGAFFERPARLDVTTAPP